MLKPAGLYALNVIDRPPLDLQKAEAKTLSDDFTSLRIVTFGFAEHPIGGNTVMLASDRAIPAGAGTERESVTTLRPDEARAFAADGEILSDDYAPTDQLISKP